VITTNAATGLTIGQSWVFPQKATGTKVTKPKAAASTSTQTDASAPSAAAVGESPSSLIVNLTGEQSDVPGWVNTIILIAWLIAAATVAAFARMLVVGRRKVHPSRHRAGLARYRLARALYRLGPLVFPIRLVYRALVVSFSWVKVPPTDHPVTMWQHVRSEGVHQA
jgi:hypothetical protein